MLEAIKEDICKVIVLLIGKFHPFQEKNMIDSLAINMQNFRFLMLNIIFNFLVKNNVLDINQAYIHTGLQKENKSSNVFHYVTDNMNIS